MPSLVTPTFRGMLPIRAPHFLDETQAANAINCQYDDGLLRPFHDVIDTNQTLKNADQRSFFMFNDSWISWSSPNVSVIPSPIGNDQWGRYYFTGHNVNQLKGLFYVATKGDGTEFLAGVPKPTVPLVAALAGTGDGGSIQEQADDETRAYVYTLVAGTGEEGPPSDPSNLVTVTQPKSTEHQNGQYVVLTIPQITSTTYTRRNIQHIRIYRTVTTSDGGAFLKVGGDIPIGQTGADKTDDILTVDLGAEMVTQDYYPPSENIEGIVSLPNGITAGFDGNTVLLSEPSLPYAWNPKNQLVTDSKIVGLGALSTGAVVLTEGQPYIMSGYTPDSMQLIKLDSPYRCLHRATIVDFGEAILYASDVGLVSVSTQGAQVITKKVINKDKWLEIVNPTHDAGTTPVIHSCRWKDNYVIFTEVHKGGSIVHKGWAFSVESGDITELTTDGRSYYQPSGSDDLYVLRNEKIFKYQDGFGSGTAIWKGREAHTPQLHLTCMKVKASQGTTIRYYRDNTSSPFTWTTTKDGEDVTRLPSGWGSRHQFEIETTGYVESLVAATSMSELNNG